LEENIDIKRIQERIGLSERTIYRIRHNAIQRGYGGENNFIFQDEISEDSPQEGRPRKMDEENED
jgi:transposase